jgi:predicted ATPase
VLCHLIEHRHRVVPKHELLDEIWGDRFVSESALTTRIKDCRRALGDDGTAQRTIKTVHRVGYRFVEEVAIGDGDPASPAPVPVDAGASTPSPSRASRWVSVDRPDRLFGRDGDRQAVLDRLDDHPVVTITGPGGVGKSQLALAVVAARDRATSPQWVCDLTATRDPDKVAEVVLAALGERPQGDTDPLTTIDRTMAGRSGVVLLDNCEHLVDAVRLVVSRLVAASGALRVLATSRSPLEVPAESVVVLEPLEPAAAVECFVARAHDNGGQVDPADPAVAELCERLDRMPLAIELAAARSRLLDPRQMLGLLDDRFRLLRTADSAPDDLHASLAATIEWSWDLLEPADAHLLTVLSVFVGSFSLDDAAGVGDPDGDVIDVIDGLDRLARASMLAVTTDPAGRRRYRLLESIRAFAASRSADPHGARRAHVQHFVALAERLDAALLTDQVDDALDAFAAAWPNVRAAVGYAHAATDTTSIRRIIRAVGAYADLHQAYEVLDWCDHAALLAADETLIDLNGPDGALAAEAVAIWARLLAHRGDHDRAAALAATARAAHRSFVTQLSMVWTAYYRGRLDEVVAGAHELGALSRSDEGVDRAYADGFDAIVAAVRQEPVLSSTDVTPADAEHGLLGAMRCLTAGFRLCAADPEQASELLEAVVAISLERDYRLLLGAAASTLTQITLPGRPPEEAMALCRTLDRYRERGMWPLISADTVMAAKLLADAGDDETAVRLLGARTASGYRVGMSEATRAGLDDELRRRLGTRVRRAGSRRGEMEPAARRGGGGRRTATPPHPGELTGQAGLRPRNVWPWTSKRRALASPGAPPKVSVARPTERLTKPAAAIRSHHSSTERLPAMQSVHRPMSQRASSGTSASAAMSANCSTPPGRRARCASANTRALSATRLSTPLLITTSAQLSSIGRSSRIPSRNSTLVAPICPATRRARSSISGVMSTPITQPVGPTRSRGDEAVEPAARPEVDHTRPGRGSRRGERVVDTGEGLDGGVGQGSTISSG